MRFLPGNAQHIGARRTQQDSFGFADLDDAAFIQHGGFLAIVCDGMGGMEHGDLAGRTAVRSFLEAYRRKPPQEPVTAALERSVREANARVVALAHSLGRAEGIGTTLVAATLLDGGPGLARLYWVSVGDSGLFHVSSGQLRMVNHPHVFANHLDQAVARGTLSVEAAMTHPERDSLTSYIGSETLEEIDLPSEPMMLAEGDSILLASDGMFKTLSPSEITLSLSGHPQNWPETLVHETLARQKEGQDNVTVLSVTVDGDPVVVSAESGSFVRPAEFAPAPVEFGSGQQPARTVRVTQPDTPPAVPPPAAPPPAPMPVAVAFPQPALSNTPWPPQPAIPAQPGSLPTAAPGNRSWTWMLGVVLLLGASAGGWWYWSHRTAAGDPLHHRSPGTPTVQTPPSVPERDPNRPLPEPNPNSPAKQPDISPSVGDRK